MGCNWSKMTSDKLLRPPPPPPRTTLGRVRTAQHGHPFVHIFGVRHPPTCPAGDGGAIPASRRLVQLLTTGL